MTYPTPLRPASDDRPAQPCTQDMAAASWPDLLQLASETVDPDTALVEQLRRRTEAQQ
ncbi:hypothetical protein [Sedimentitalea todarodis]|uniref:Uncharacterized protein n=1 Tax=Sedimentitalea todarodis TaxID=1631240 RepID=A0ABU3VAW2_9RHOB|nr:hypothetical protein [Sedimentitalea todarodis]MDU9002909.1 hypothetical protein [Sedimentitalea todarodis]